MSSITLFSSVITESDLMCKEHVVYDFLVDDGGFIHQSVNFPPGSAFLDPFEQEDEAIDWTETSNFTHYFPGHELEHLLKYTNFTTLDTCFEDHIFLLLGLL